VEQSLKLGAQILHSYKIMSGAGTSPDIDEGLTEACIVDLFRYIDHETDFDLTAIVQHGFDTIEEGSA